MSPRDSQRSKVYAAERATFHDYSQPWQQAEYPTLAEATALVRRVERSASWAKLCDRGGMARTWRPVTVEAGRNGGHAWGTHTISLGRYGRQDWVVLHELAHIATTRRYGDLAAAAHGWQFCDTYLRLVRTWLGKPQRDALRAAFRAHGVRYTAPRAKRQLTPEQKAELTARLARAREAKAAGGTPQ